MSTKPLLDIAELVIGRRTSPETPPILEGVGLSLKAGDFLAVVGESGSGKTTLSHAVIGLLSEALSIRSGRIDFLGRDLAGLSDRDFARIRGRDIGFVPQDPGASLNPVKTIGAQLLEVFALHPEIAPPRGEARIRALDLLRDVGIDRPEERFRQYPHQLSGGMKQRVLLAIAFALKPRLLIADEPTSALDVTVQKQVMAVLQRLVSENGTTVIFVTHDIALAAEYASRLLVMRGGKIVEDGALADVLAKPRDAYTRTLLANALPQPHDGKPAGEDTPALIEVEELVKRFGGKSSLGRRKPSIAAVDGVSFSVRAGRTFALVGESGSGKSTTARIIIGLETASEGSVRFGGADVTHLPPGERRLFWRGIQLVHQNPFASLNPRATLAEIIASPLVAHRIGDAASRRERVRELLEQVGLPAEFAGRRPAELSGGQRQRVAIARALALKAGVIILDEALSALDVVTQAQILTLLHRLQRDIGLTYIFISHDLGVVRDFADDVGVMQRGRLVETGTVADVFTRPASPYTRALLDAHPGEALARYAAA